MIKKIILQINQFTVNKQLQHTTNIMKSHYTCCLNKTKPCWTSN